VLGAAGSRFLPRVSATGVVDHPRLATLVRRAQTRPLVTITAAPGWGKTTFAAQWAAGTGASWCNLDVEDGDPARLATALIDAHPGTPEVELGGGDVDVLAAQVAQAWHAAGSIRLVLDDAHTLLGTRALGLLERIRTAIGPGSQLLLVSREDLGLVGPRDRASATVLELDATHLALTTDRVARLLEDELTPDRALAARVVDATGGWPAAVRLVVEALHDVPATLRSARVPALTAADGPIGEYVRGVLVPATDDEVVRLLTQLALVGDTDRLLPPPAADAPTTDPLTTDPLTTDPLTTDPLTTDPLASARLVALGFASTAPCTGSDHAADTSRAAASDRGDGAEHGPSASHRVVVAPVVRRVLLDRLLPTRADRHALVDEVVKRLLHAGRIGRALEVLTEVGRVDAAADLLERHGDALIDAGDLTAVCAAATAVPAPRRSERLERLHGQALAYRGEWASALRCLGAAGTDGEGPLSTELALGVGMVHHLRGDLDTAIHTYARGPAADRDDPRHAALLAWRSTAHWLRGEVEDARRFARAAMDEATATRDDRSLGLAHTAMALVAATDGDRRANEAHYEQAFAAAGRAGDGLQQARILTNRGSRHLENGEYDEALRLTDRAIDLAERQGFAMIVGVARCNRAEILLRSGRLDEAVADAEDARDTFARIGSTNESYAHHLLGDARREQGDLVLARQAYERGLRLADPSGVRQGQVPAYVGLARTLVGVDPDAAESAAIRASVLDDGMATVTVQLTAAWTALARDEPGEAGRLAREARQTAEQREDRAGVAEAATLLALLDDDPAPALRDAAHLWWEVGARISATRAELGAARRSSHPEARAEAETLERRLVAWGCSPDGGAYAHRAVAGFGLRSRPAIRVLGTFVVERDGRPVPRADWGSKKARELLKVLVVRGGRSISREELADLLWPGEAYETVANRLSVALSVVRGVLATETPGRDGPALRADDTSVALDPTQIDIDLQRFRHLAEEGLRRARTTERDRALELLLAAEEAYGGDLLEDDRDVPWLVDRREELRTLYISVARTSAQLVGEDDPDRAMRLLLRVLDRDGYDEPAHLGVCRALLRSGRHGEARRRHRLYTARMAELDLPAVPLHDLRPAHDEVRVTEDGSGLVRTVRR
jgi:DNA-binding SARP family transcriptional activator/ATP/maltotriose-dependent transcriptional regulator MalT